MGFPDETAFAKELRAAAEQCGLIISQKESQQLIHYLQLVLEKNKQLNLTAIEDLEKGLYLHLLASLLYVLVVQELQEEGLLPENCSFIDMGTGGGFPGIPFGIVTENQGILVDSVQKKAQAVGEFLTALSLSGRLTAEGKRIEEIAQERRKKADLVLARALSSLDVLLEYASPLLKEVGFLVVSKGSPTPRELEHARIVGHMVGMEYVSRETFELPKGMGRRELLVFQKNRESQIELPRKPGMATKRPLSYQANGKNTLQ